MNYKRSKYFTTSNKRRIKYLYFNQKSQVTVVFFHGFMSNMIGTKPTKLKKFCKKVKLNFLIFEYSGHGKSSGKFIEGNISKWTSDAKQLIKAKTKSKKLIFIGSSMGSWIALNLFPIFKRRLKGFVGISSAPEFLEKLMWRKFNKKIKKIVMTRGIYHLKHDKFVYPLSKQLILDGRKNKVLNKKINLNIPFILFYGTKDKVVPPSFSRNIIKICKSNKKKLIKIKNGDHSLSKKSDLKKICNELYAISKNENSI